MRPHLVYHPIISKSLSGNESNVINANGLFIVKLKNYETKGNMKSMKSSLCSWVGALGALLACLDGSRAPGATIAYWQFESSNMGADTSGNGNTLVFNNVSSSTDTATNAPGAGSASFSGSSSAQTASPVNLSSYTNLTIEWFMKSTQVNSGSATGIVFEQSANYNSNPGGVVGFLSQTAGQPSLHSGARGSNGYANAAVQIGSDGGWHHYAVTFNQNLGLAASHIVKVYIDGVASTTTNVLISSPINVLAPFRNDYFYLGARNASSLYFVGNLDEFRISDAILTPDQFLAPFTFTNAVLTITQQPANVTAEANSYALFSVGVAVANGPVSDVDYQWQVLNPGATAWMNIPGANMPFYWAPVRSPAASGTQYRVQLLMEASGGVGAASAPATVTVQDGQGGPVAGFGFLADGTPLGLGEPVVAYWQFGTANPGADSSGNNHTLNLTGVTITSDVATNAPGTTSSATFNGTSSFAKTLTNLDQQVYAGATIEWYMKTSDSTLGMIYEHSAQYGVNPGAMAADISELGGGRLSAYNSGASGYGTATKDMSIPDGLWHHYAVTADTALISTNRLRVYIDGVFVTNLLREGNMAVAQTALWGPDTFNLGSRNGASRFFSGEIADFRITGNILSPDQFLSPVTYPNAVLSITQQPIVTTVAGITTISAGAGLGNAPASALNYQWQIKGPGQTSWTDILEASLPTYTVSSPLIGTQYRVAVWAGGSAAASISQVVTFPAPPSLQIVASGANIIVSWPATATGFTLQTTPQLSPSSWSTVGAYPVVEGGLNEVTLPLKPTASFYRLVAPSR